MKEWIIHHVTSPRWEAGEPPSPELIARVGTLMAQMQKADVLRAAEGLRASSQGLRVRFSRDELRLDPGPFAGERELAGGWDILRVSSRSEAVEWARRLATLLGDGEIDVRPVTEPWDIGLAPRPGDITTSRFMLLRKADAASELSEGDNRRRQRTALAQFRRELQQAGVHLEGADLRPSVEGKRLRRRSAQTAIIDGPFAESKELIAGYVRIRVASIEVAVQWAGHYLEAVDSAAVELREIDLTDLS